MASLAQACSGISSVTYLSGSQEGLQKVNRGNSRVVCKKEGIHPKFFPEAKVYCNGVLVMTTGGTQAEYVVDVWSGNHPFYQGNKSTLVSESGQLDKFMARYGNLGNLGKIPTLTKGEIIIEKKSKGQKKGGRK